MVHHVLSGVLGPRVLGGILFPESFMTSDYFSILAAFVAINTVMYAALAVAKILPRVYPLDWIDRGNRRRESRSIYPEERPTRGSERDAVGHALGADVHHEDLHGLVGSVLPIMRSADRFEDRRSGR